MSEPRWGSVRLSRKAFTSDLWLEPRRFSRFEAWVDLIGRAVFKKTTVTIREQAIPLERGEFCYSVRTLAEDWRWSTTSVHRFLEQLQKDERIRERSTERCKERIPPVYLIVNYETYQDNPAVGGTPTGTPSGTSKKEVVKKYSPSERADQGNWVAAARQFAVDKGFYFDHGIVGRFLKEHVDEHGWERIERVWKGYLERRPYLDWDRAVDAGRDPGDPTPDTRFVGPQDFHKNFGYWDEQATPIKLLAQRRAS